MGRILFWVILIAAIFAAVAFARGRRNASVESQKAKSGKESGSGFMKEIGRAPV